MINIIIADDQELIRESLNILLNAKDDFQVIDLVKTGAEVLNSIQKKKPDLILMDIRMPEMDGVQCTKIIKETYPDIQIILLTTFDDDEYIYNALKYGADGYLLKEVSPNELTSAIKTVHNGGSIIHPNVATKAINLFSEMANHSQVNIQTDESGVQNLSDKEWQVIEKVGLGLSNKEIAHELHFTEGTIRNYLSIILDKLQLRDRTQLAIWYLQSGNRKNSSHE
ncbi:DNA-binding NarL/FixJ family response regulator [Breznakia sp. PF5-3]|uniref:response regulator transcription factor n=1 Tax=unclassified Breznakia TaxID=2623764 RepID=UPI002404D4F2|nr:MULTISPECIES: response regulator transcription factor [unclassified Breznakia]MDF9824860.1 DNA-binding NarL/FixJ family response regulator [Breznakia sp. PM6-1]MDF9835717.1 DNA-binding NarL/FixJ family response regulator [Breznakia sp. PF5-3]MDF9838277.1 DNA-binding NarL/FixJ family response regulator [Breznakia sp. PFB2-8]MDF9860284.1 DNA-binding NarL/FixJ family response regulator [Breznakia sp. PH5-24]